MIHRGQLTDLTIMARICVFKPIQLRLQKVKHPPTSIKRDGIVGVLAMTKRLPRMMTLLNVLISTCCGLLDSARKELRVVLDLM